jgi:hypothetical protein
VPVKGAWYTCVAVCFICFFLDLEELSMIINLGNLLNSAFINAAAIAIRFRDPNQDQIHVIRGKNEIYVWGFTLLSFMLAMSNGWELNAYI